MYLFVGPLGFPNVFGIDREGLVNLLYDSLQENDWDREGRKRSKKTDDFFLLGLVCQAGTSQITTRLFQVVERFFDPFDIFKTKFCLDDFHIADRIDISLDVNDLCIVKRTNDLEDSIYGTDMGEESIAEPSSSRSTLAAER